MTRSTQSLPCTPAFTLIPLFQTTHAKDTGRVFIDEFIEYIRKNSPISPTLDDRIKPVNGAA